MVAYPSGAFRRAGRDVAAGISLGNDRFPFIFAKHYEGTKSGREVLGHLVRHFCRSGAPCENWVRPPRVDPKGGGLRTVGESGREAKKEKRKAIPHRYTNRPRGMRVIALSWRLLLTQPLLKALLCGGSLYFVVGQACWKLGVGPGKPWGSPKNLGGNGLEHNWTCRRPKRALDYCWILHCIYSFHGRFLNPLKQKTGVPDFFSPAAPGFSALSTNRVFDGVVKAGEVASGRLKPGHLLPSFRLLAEENLCVSQVLSRLKARVTREKNSSVKGSSLPIRAWEKRLWRIPPGEGDRSPGKKNRAKKKEGVGAEGLAGAATIGGAAGRNFSDQELLELFRGQELRAAADRWFKIKAFNAYDLQLQFQLTKIG